MHFFYNCWIKACYNKNTAWRNMMKERRYYEKEIEKINPSVNVLLNMACLSSCSYLFFTQIPAFSVRVSEVFNCVLIILIPLLIRAFKPKALAEAVVLIIGFCIFYIYAFHSGIVQDYKFIWS